MKYNEYKLKCDVTNFIHAPSHSKEESLWCLLKWKWHLFKCMVPITDNQMRGFRAIHSPKRGG